MKKLKLFESLLALLCAVLLLLTSIYAWITLRPDVEIEEFVVTSGDYQIEVILSLNKNGGEYSVFSSKTEIEEFFQDAVPNDDFGFHLNIKNLSSFIIESNIFLENVRSSNLSEGFDMLDVFYIVDGVVLINSSPSSLDVNSLEEENLHNQDLNLYRLNNLVDDNNNIHLIEDLQIDLEEIVIIEFNIKYDHNTSNFFYQEGIINIDSILIRFD